MNRDQKAAAIAEIVTDLQEAEAVYAIDYRGITVTQASELRTRLREADASFRVVKNTLTERAADEADAEQLKGLLAGPTALTFVRGDVAAAAKAIADYQRATDKLAFKGGLMNGQPLDPEQLAAIAKLPSREVLYGQLVGMVASPLTGLASALNGLISGIARQLQAIADQGLVPAAATGGAAAPAAPAAETGGEREERAGDTEPATGGEEDPDAGPASTPDSGPHPDPEPGVEPSEG